MSNSPSSLNSATVVRQVPSGILARTFLDHPASVGESYFGHLRFALRFSSRLFMAGVAALIHAFIPSLCKTTASRAIRTMHSSIHTRS